MIVISFQVPQFLKAWFMAALAWGRRQQRGGARHTQWVTWGYITRCLWMRSQVILP